MSEPTVIQVPVRVITRARTDAVDGERDGRLLVRTSAPPEGERANAAVVRLVAGHFGVPVRSVEIVSGRHHRDKLLQVTR